MAKYIIHVEIYVGGFLKREFLSRLFHLVTATGEWTTAHHDCYRRFHRKYLRDSEWTGYYCHLELLSQVFSRLPRVEFLKVTSTKCPFPGCPTYMREAWSDMCSCVFLQDAATSSRRYLNTLLAASQSFKQPLRNLALEGVPINMFSLAEEPGLPNALLLKNWASAGSGITDLRIQVNIHQAHFDSGGFSCLAKNMGKFLSSFKTLHSLDLAWCIGSLKDESRHVWQPEFYGNHFPHLKTLKTTGLETADDMMIAFLKLHSTTLTQLSLLGCSEGYPAPQTAIGHGFGSFREFLTRIKENLKLEKCQIITNLISADRELIYDHDWNSICGYPEPCCNWKSNLGEPLKKAKLFEMFVLGLCSWPMFKDNSDGRGRWRRLPEWGTTESDEDFSSSESDSGSDSDDNNGEFNSGESDSGSD